MAKQRASTPDHSNAYPAPVRDLLEVLARLPGIGRRSAERLALHILKLDAESAMALADAIARVKTEVGQCEICFNFTDDKACAVCRDERRDRSLVLVVEQPRDLIALEQTGMYRGLYHVLLGRISPLEGVGEDDLTIGALLARIDSPERNAGGARITEVILGLNPTLEGDGTALYLQQVLSRRGVRVSRLARGLPTGSQLEYANKAVLADAILGRQSVD